MPLEKEKVGLIVLGASKFPRSTYAGSKAFAASKERMKSYFEIKFGVEKFGLLLDLFDSNFDPNKIDDEIRNFINNKPQISDLVIYYVGHGGYDTTFGFLLAIRTSKDSNLGISSITAQALGKTFSSIQRNVRLFVILDCCFSAEIFQHLQSEYMDVISKDISENFPQNGLALLCSSSRKKPSLIVKDGAITMFTEALSLTLEQGSPIVKNEYLTLREIAEITYSHIKSANPDKSIRPEVHSPRMPNGDISAIPHFPNPGFKLEGLVAAYDILRRKKDIENCVRYNKLLDAASLFMDFVNDFDKFEMYSIEEPLICSDCRALEEEKPSIDNPKYDSYKKDREILYRKILSIVNELIKIWKSKVQND
jgi:hypothetical protein